MVDKVFLTDKRRDVLAGESDLEGNSLAVSKSRIRKRARLALTELIEVAESEQIDSSDIFDPTDVHRLLVALTTPPMADGPVDPMNPEETIDDDWQAYRDRLYVQLSKVQQFQRKTDQ
jgi:hypothetical protein